LRGVVGNVVFWWWCFVVMNVVECGRNTGS
jgi:hypothetical protein